MKLTETAAVLAKIALHDGRRITTQNPLTGKVEADQTIIASWHEVIGDLPFADALHAVAEHRKTSGEYLMPHHVRALVEAVHAWRREADRAALDTTQPVGTSQRGALLTRHVLAALKAAGSDPAAGKFLGRKQCADVAETAMREALRKYPAEHASQRQGAHCGRVNCMCLHSTDPDTGDRCDGGWIEAETKTSDQVKQCRQCNPERAKLLTPTTTRHQAQAALRLQKKPRKAG